MEWKSARENRLAVIVAVLVAVSIMAIVHFGSWFATAPSADSATATGQSGAAEPLGAQPPSGSRRTRADFEARLPTSSAPAARTLRALAEDALAGSPTAACWVGQALSRCASVGASLEMAEALASVPTSPYEGDGKSLSESLLEQAERAAVDCTGIDDATTAQAFKFQRLAALNGDMKHLRWLVVAPALRQDRFVEDLEDWIDYRALAKEYVQRAMERRSAEDLPVLISIFAPESYRGLRPPYRVDDPATFAALVRAATANGIEVPRGLVPGGRLSEVPAGRSVGSAAGADPASSSADWTRSTAPRSITEILLEQQADTFCD